MKNNIINKTILGFLCVIVGFTACSDWTETESIGIESPKVEDQNPDVYKKYLENLRKYKESNHKVVYAWLDNSSKQPANRSFHMEALPDSIDYIVLEHPSNLADWELKEMDVVREKGTKVLAQFNFDATKAEYEAKIGDMIKEELDVSQEPPFIDVLIEKIDKDLKSTTKYKFDGLVFAYKGKGVAYMTEIERIEYMQYYNASTRLISIWKENNPEMILTFAGNPQNILDKANLEMYKHIIISTNTAKNFGAVTFEVSKAIGEGIPTDRFIVTAENLSLDKDDTTTGYWSNGERALPSMAEWVNSSHSGFSIVGMGIYGVSNDYYNPDLIFPVTRNAIQILNPSLKTE